MEFELGHINVSVKSDEEAQGELDADQRSKKEGNITGGTPEDDKPIISWHHDSYPFVCVTMLSDCSGMIGGETVLRTGDGGTIKVRGPQMVIMELTRPSQKSTADMTTRDTLSYFKDDTSPIKHSALSAPASESQW
jgi:hypothetical protein